MSRRIVVVGTGTDIGKTHVTCCLLRAGRPRTGASALRTGAYKPIATGFTDVCEDATRHAAASGMPYVAPTYGYRRPVSPHLAAREEGRPIDLARVRARADELAAGLDVQIVEGAGGLFSPLGPGVTNVDLVRALGPAMIVLVAPDRLGVLHDLGAAIAGARAAGLDAPAVVLSAPAAPDDATGTNAAELSAIGLADVVAVFPRAADDAPESLAAAAAVLRGP
jgi:dethiobiotin synthetase